MSNPYTDEFGFPLTYSQTLMWMQNKRKPLFIDGRPVPHLPSPPPLNLAAKLIAKAAAQQKKPPP